jgi:hypothetical protein
VQPLATVTIKRPWHWGIAILSDPTLGGRIPHVDPNAAVSFNEAGVVVLVRHAQDQVPNFEPGFDWAEATVAVRLLVDKPPVEPDRRVILDGLLSTPTARLSVGDADADVVLPAHPVSSAIRVSVLAEASNSPEEVWIDLSPVEK